MFGRVKINARRVVIGKNVKFEKNVVIKGFKQTILEYLEIGDNCHFFNDVEIHVTPRCIIGANNVFHNCVHIVGSNTAQIGDNNWVGERSFLDSTGKLTIDSGCVIGLNCQIWSHAIRPSSTYSPRKPPLINIHNVHPTRIKDNAWLQGGNIQVAPGVTIAEDTLVLANAVVSKNTVAGKIYGGIPAKEIIRAKK